MEEGREVAIRPFRHADQEPARALILAGLAERWGELDPTLNRDLDDIWGHYVATGGAFWVACRGDLLLATGALSVVESGVGRIERVSVRATHRQQGLGQQISRQLLAEARRRRYRLVLVETTATWQDAVRLYRRLGFRPVDYRDGDVHMEFNPFSKRSIIKEADGKTAVS